MPDLPCRDVPVLDRILASKRAELAAERSSALQAETGSRPAPARRGFRAAVESRQPAIIAEIKKASPSAGLIAADFDPAAIARSYQAAGAAALSVLTDRRFFQGSLEDLATARAATSLPVLRKDFTLDRYHVLQASAWAADCILLIVAALADSELRDLHQAAQELNLETLVEVHDGCELDRALAMGARMIGVNNRNLKTMEISLQTSIDLAERFPPGVLRITESGIRTAEDLCRLRDAGYQGFLVGEGLMRQPDQGRALAALTRSRA